VAQDVLAHAMLLGPGTPRRSRPVGEDRTGFGDHAGEVPEPRPRVGPALVPSMRGIQQGPVVRVIRFGDGLFKAHVAAHRVTVVAENRASEQPGRSPIAVLERVDDEQVQYEQPGEEHRMVSARRNRVPVALDKVIDGERGARRGHRLKRTVVEPPGEGVDDQVVLGLERAAGHRGVSEQQPVQVQDQASLQRRQSCLNR
jgi:hypothetical protein